MSRILVVDDDVIIRRVVGLMLERGGYEVTSAPNVEQARKALCTEPVDLLITDLNLPDADGFTLMRWMRGKHSLTNVPVIMLTGSIRERDDLTARAEGVAAFLTKPVASFQLLETVQRTLA